MTPILATVFINTVVPGFRALGPSTALGALNPGSALNRGTTLINNLEIVNSHLMVDLKNPTFFKKKTSKELEQKINSLPTKRKVYHKKQFLVHFHAKMSKNLVFC